eukprot:2755258-Karenia_brevis.AAC.1
MAKGKGNDPKKHDDKKRVSKIITQREASSSASSMLFSCDAESSDAAQSHVSCMSFKSIAKEARLETSQGWTELVGVPPQPFPSSAL